MNVQHLETQNEPETEAYSRALIPENATDEAPVPPLPTEAEIQQLFAQTRAQEAVSGPGPQIRNFLTGGRAKDPTPLLQMGLDEVLAVLNQESRKRGKRQKLFVGLFLGMAALFTLIAILTHNTSIIASMGGYISLTVIGAAASQQQKSASLAIARFDDVRAIGALAEALEFKDKRVAPIAEKSLIHLLPRLKASDASLLNPEQRFCLNRALRGKNTELTVAILKAWEQIGDERAIEEVEKLARGRGRGGSSPTVVVAAQECLPFLRQSAERQQIGSQLLRPSDGNLTPSDVLLRPATPHASTDPADQLLRPTNAV